ncbi:bifunctional (p)ppGpp synthetase/guanosine-3',5'-bis(diphosphate) 3'-pyrophosphohydrolase [uncultured Clostridium sp.]|uniref:RelA/SpoT family protein n=1 Tax=uncultured Clostridium sp. TaxID=59620 RepID=UPI0026375344|nr:bifunctional (p)ppGpp synthetase/guanosine-3',5'-bis(diphosphate) 3'-pyrophosphohydrolase [uncultured Clostridium sp.]
MLKELIIRVEKGSKGADIELIKKAYDLAVTAHIEQKRESGEPYVMHPINVAMILADMGMDTSTIVAGLLHDVIEDTEFTYEDIKEAFGEEIANLVDGVTKLGQIQYKSKQEQQADNVRKMLLAMARDIRVIIVKLADRLHNMRTLKHMTLEKQKAKAQETLDIYAPLAHRLGMSKIKWELEDLCLRYIQPKEYYSLVKDIAEKRIEREHNIEKIVSDIDDNLKQSNLLCDIEGRPKHFYSIYKKMVSKNKSLDQIFDLTAIRILVNSVKDCYAVLGIVHTIYKPIPGRFKDYIAMPKPNMYQSLHTTVIGEAGRTFEIQIRTFDMHRTAEYGIAAHWKYKQGENVKEPSFENKLGWLQEILEWQDETSDAEEFMEGFKLDLFSDEIFIFTPKGVVLNLPAGATPIDFAYRIHTDVGNRCIGAKVNGKMVTLDYNLKTGQIVEVLTATAAKGPNMSWLNFAKSNQARSKIKQWFKRIRKEENIEKGKEHIEKESKKQSINFMDIAKGERYDKLMKKYNFNVIEDIFAGIGAGILSANTVISKLKGEVVEVTTLDKAQLEIEEQMAKAEKLKQLKGCPNTSGVSVKGLSNLMIRFAKCCNPVPGDEIVGYVTKGRGISVHRADCSNFKHIIEIRNEKVIDVIWNRSSGECYEAELEIKAEDTSGYLSEVMMVISDLKVNITSLNAKTTKSNFTHVNVKVKVDSVDKLRDLMKKLRKIKGTKDVYRVKN